MLINVNVVCVVELFDKAVTEGVEIITRSEGDDKT